ncbi:MAG: outer membrane protein assembly factor BamD [Lentisphaeria bacterium]|nr:outer membrane protein assembly factor BamD [Lentisphaeria bacterium]
MKNPVLKSLLYSGVLCLTMALRADDGMAIRTYAEGRELYLAGSYYDAAEKFEECRFYSGDPTIRANCLKAQLAAYRMCKLYYREFLLIEELLEKYPDHADCNELIAREFEIADLCLAGFREPAFWIFRWVPWLSDEDRTAEVFNAALARAPYSGFAPAARMKLAIHFDRQGDARQAIIQLREIVDKHPGSPEMKYALLALADGLFALSGRSDGDSRCINEAVELFERFCREYPDAPETEFARNRLARAKDVQAKKLFEIAEFYRKSGRSDVAERYLARLMSRYPDSETAAEAEHTLVNISADYLPGRPPQSNEARYPDIRSYSIPENAELLLISPHDAGSHFLLNVPDLKGEKVPSKQEGDEK